ncbi:MAG TPA: 6-carboxytetrahydropterin synthase, partial [Bacteroidales bacterium]|nr:6-carboxytetrahydropterin synthase [Bacteroidales bacterium]
CSKYDNNRLTALTSMLGNAVLVDYQPTCENMVADFAARISAKLPGGISLFSLKLYETATSYAEWFAADNK